MCLPLESLYFLYHYSISRGGQQSCEIENVLLAARYTLTSLQHRWKTAYIAGLQPALMLKRILLQGQEVLRKFLRSADNPGHPHLVKLIITTWHLIRITTWHLIRITTWHLIWIRHLHHGLKNALSERYAKKTKDQTPLNYGIDAWHISIQKQCANCLIQQFTYLLAMYALHQSINKSSFVHQQFDRQYRST